MDSSLLDLVYRCVVDPRRWDDVLLRIADRFNAESVVLQWQDVYTNDVEAIFGNADPEALQQFSAYFAARNPLRLSASAIARKMEAWTPQLVLDDDQMAREDFVKTEFYNDFFRRYGYDSSLAIGLAVDGAAGSTIDVLRPARAGRFAEDDLAFARQVQPHLVRAFEAGRVAAAASGGLSQSGAAAFETWTSAVFVVSAKRQVRYMNGMAETLARRGIGLRVVNDVLGAVDSRANQSLDAAVKTAASPGSTPRSGAFLAVSTTAEALPLSVTISPLHGDEHAIYHAPCALVMVRDPSQELALSPEKLQAVFGFSVTETKVAMALFGGSATSEVADRMGISINTVRNHLARILEKTHSSGQAELSRKLMSLA